MEDVDERVHRVFQTMYELSAALLARCGAYVLEQALSPARKSPQGVQDPVLASSIRQVAIALVSPILAHGKEASAIHASYMIIYV